VWLGWYASQEAVGVFKAKRRDKGKMICMQPCTSVHIESSQLYLSMCGDGFEGPRNGDL